MSASVDRQLHQLARSVNGLHKRLDVHEHAINGTNGQKGCKTRLTLLEETTARLAAAQTRAYWFTVTYLAVGLITLIGSLVAAVYK